MRGVGGESESIVASSKRGGKQLCRRRVRSRRRVARCDNSAGGISRPIRMSSSSDCVMGPAAKHCSDSSSPRQIVNFWSVSLANRDDQCDDLNAQVRANLVRPGHSSSVASSASVGRNHPPGSPPLEHISSAVSDGSCGRKLTSGQCRP